MKKTKSDFLRFIDDQINSQRKISLQKALQNREKFQELLGDELELSERITSIESHLGRISRELKVPAEEVLNEAEEFFSFMPPTEKSFVKKHLIEDRIEFIQAMRCKPVPNLPAAALAMCRTMEALYSRYDESLKNFIKNDEIALDKYGLDKTEGNRVVLDEKTGLPKLKRWLTKKHWKCPRTMAHWPLYYYFKSIGVELSIIPNDAIYNCWQLRHGGKSHTDAGRSPDEEDRVRQAQGFFFNNEKAWREVETWILVLGTTLPKTKQVDSF